MTLTSFDNLFNVMTTLYQRIIMVFAACMHMRCTSQLAVINKSKCKIIYISSRSEIYRINKDFYIIL